MKKSIAIAAALAAILTPGASALANPSTQAAPREASIPFVNHGGIRNYRIVDDSTVLIEGNSRKWYKAELMGPCTGLSFNADIALGFETRGVDTFDRYGTIRTRDGQSCAVRSLTETPAPARKK